MHGAGIRGPRNYPKAAGRAFPAARSELLKHKGIVMSKSWPVGSWLSTRRAKDRVVACLQAARPLNAWLERYVA